MQYVYLSFGAVYSTPRSLSPSHTHTLPGQQCGLRAPCGILAKGAEMAARKVSMVAQRECVRVRGLWCGPLGGDVAKGPGRGALFFFFPHSPLYNQGCNQQRAKLPKFAGRSRRAAHQGRRARETNKDARKHTVKHRAKRDYILSFARTAKANAPERRLGWFWKCYNNTGARRAREGEALSGLFSFFFRWDRGWGATRALLHYQ